MTSSYNSYYKLNHGFIKDKSSDMSSIDRKLRGMLENLRKERRQEFLRLQRNEGEEHLGPRGKRTGKGSHSKFIRDWKLSRAWSNELIEYRWLSKVSEGYRSMQDCPQEWLVLPLCEGRRSLLIQGNGYCEIRNQEGWRMFTVKNAPFTHNGLTIIDGVYDQDQNVFHCNDLIVWNNLNMCTSTTECRLHFLSCRIEESGVTSRPAAEDSDIYMKLDSLPRLVPNIRIQLGKYYPLSRDNLVNICGTAGQLGGAPPCLGHLVFVRRDSLYEADKDCTHLGQRCQECCLDDSQQGWLIWRDQETSVFNREKDTETETFEATFRLNANEKNELYTKDGVLVGKVSGPGTISESLSLDEDQKVLMNEYGLVFVKVKFGDEHMLDVLDLILSGNPLSSDLVSKDASPFELSSVSSQDKLSSKLDSSDYVLFRCAELVAKAKHKRRTVTHEERYLNLNMESLLNSIS